MPEIGTIEDLGIQMDKWRPLECKRRLDCVVACLVCGNEVELWAPTDHWKLDYKKYYEHVGFGPAQGTCCEVDYTDVEGHVCAVFMKEVVETKTHRVIDKRDEVPADKVRRQ